MQEVFTLGGRRFEAAAEGTTFEQDAYIMGLVLEHGIEKVIEANGDVAGAVLRSGCVSKFIAGILVEIDTEWSIERARANAKFFSGLRTPAEKDVLNNCLRGLLAGFFAAGAGSSRASATVSATPATTSTTTDPSRATRPTRASATGRSSARRSRTTPTRDA